VALALPLGLIGSAALVWQASYAAFTATTTNPGNSWTAGTVVLSDDDGATAIITATHLKPGSTDTRCIEVWYTGNLGAAVELYLSPGDLVTTPDLAPYLQLTVEEGSGGGAGNCAGFTPTSTLYPASGTGTLSGFSSTHGSYATGAGAWAPVTAENRTYRFTWTLDPNTTNPAQGDTATATFTWEARNT